MPVFHTKTIESILEPVASQVKFKTKDCIFTCAFSLWWFVYQSLYPLTIWEAVEKPFSFISFAQHSIGWKERERDVVVLFYFYPWRAILHTSGYI